MRLAAADVLPICGPGEPRLGEVRARTAAASPLPRGPSQPTRDRVTVTVRAREALANFRPRAPRGAGDVVDLAGSTTPRPGFHARVTAPPRGELHRDPSLRTAGLAAGDLVEGIEACLSSVDIAPLMTAAVMTRPLRP